MSRPTKAKNAKSNREYRKRQREERNEEQAQLRDERLLRSQLEERVRVLEEQRLSSVAYMADLQAMLTATPAQSDPELLAEVTLWRSRYEDLVVMVEESSLSREEQMFVLSKIHPDKNGNSPLSNRATEKLLRRARQ